MTSDLVERLRALDSDLAARQTALLTNHHQQKRQLLSELLEECGSVAGVCRALDVSRSRWYQLADRYDLPRSPWDPTVPQNLRKSR